jgi:4-hydroxybenzoate polyprenyltransferase
MIDRILTYGRMIKFSHSIFALPFALSGVLLASMRADITTGKVAWIIVAMVGARSAAMGFNRWADRKMDAENPRTANRELPTGQISSGSVIGFIVLSSLMLVYAAYRLNPLCFVLSPMALTIVFFYSLTKRFTWVTQFFLGLSLSVAPIGAWIAVTGTLDPEILALGGAVLLWVAGFDIIYATNDADFDRKFGAFSIPQRFGVTRALWIARFLHLSAFFAMLSVGQVFGLGVVYYAGVLGIGFLLIYEHRLVKPDDLSRAGIAFMNLNAAISVAYFVFTAVDILVV